MGIARSKPKIVANSPFRFVFSRMEQEKKDSSANTLFFCISYVCPVDRLGAPEEEKKEEKFRCTRCKFTFNRFDRFTWHLARCLAHPQPGGVGQAARRLPPGFGNDAWRITEGWTARAIGGGARRVQEDDTGWRAQGEVQTVLAHLLRTGERKM